MAITYKSQGAGVSTETSAAALSPLCPATVDAGDILVAHVFWEGTTTTPSTPTGWTLLSGPHVIETTIARHWVYGKIASGSEDGAAAAFGAPAVTTQRGARIYSFAGRVAGTIGELVTGFAHLSHATDPAMPTVTTVLTGSLAVALVAQNDNNAFISPTGESGGDWVEAVAEYTVALTPGFSLGIETATPTGNPGTISGGTMATTNDPCGVIGFEIKDSNPIGIGVGVLAGLAPTVETPRNVTAALGAITCTGFAPIVAASNEYQVILDRATTLGYTHPSTAQKILQNTLLSAIKSAGVWDDLDVLWIFATNGDGDFATLNWKIPASFQCTKVNSPTFTPIAGYKGNGSTSYLNTNWATTDAIQLTGSSVHVLTVLDDWPAPGSGIEFGGGTFANTLLTFSLHYRQANLCDLASTSFDPEPPTDGTWSANRNGTAVNIYKNNVSLVSPTVAVGGALNSTDLFVGGYSNNGTLDQPIATVVRILAIGKSLDSTKRTALYSAVSTYLTSFLPDIGAATWNGFAPTVAAGSNLNITTDVGAGVYAGFAPTIQTPLNITADIGVATYNGFAPTVEASAGLNILPSVGDVLYAGFAPTVSVTNHLNLAPSVGVGLYAGLAPTIETPKNITTDIGVCTWNGFSPTILTPINITAGVGAGILAGLAPTIQTPRNITAGIGAATYNGFAPTLVLPRNITAGLGAAVYTGFAPSVAAGTGAFPDVGSVILTGFGPTVSVTNHKNITADVGAGIFTGVAPTVFASDTKNILIGLGEVTFTGFEPTVFTSDNKNIAIGLGEMVMVGYNPTIGTQPTTVSPSIGEATLLGYEPIVVASTTPINVPEPKRMRIIYLD